MGWWCLTVKQGMGWQPFGCKARSMVGCKEEAWAEAWAGGVEKSCLVVKQLTTQTEHGVGEPPFVDPHLRRIVGCFRWSLGK
ncbi:hypothetical protein PIB30_094893 [Stylosanthes scabra]|uniref:Uncharacterized protein n=1 Tax=Stylosanthes scabra TaxID=79078 RepID=A0ABU6YW50_9FABA|nr:hypothetical protein [Stylosanthes scabra]